MKKLLLLFAILLAITGTAHAQTEVRIFNGSKCHIILDIEPYTGCTPGIPTTGVTIAPWNSTDISILPGATDYKIDISEDITGSAVVGSISADGSACPGLPTTASTISALGCNCNGFLTAKSVTTNIGVPMWLIVVY